MNLQKALFDRGAFRETAEDRAKREAAREAHRRGVVAGMVEAPADHARRAAAEPAPARKSSAGISNAIFVDAYQERKQISTVAERFAKLSPEVQRLGQLRNIHVDVLEVFSHLLLQYRANGGQPLNIDSSDVAQIMGTTDADKGRTMLNTLLGASLLHRTSTGGLGSSGYRPATNF